MHQLNNTFGGKVGMTNIDSKIAGFLKSFDSKLNQFISIKLDDIKLQAISLKKALEDGGIDVPNENNIIIFLNKTSSIIDDEAKDPVDKARSIGYSFDTDIKINKATINQNSIVRDGVVRMIYDYLDIAKASSDPEMQTIAINVAEDFQTP